MRLQSNRPTALPMRIFCILTGVFLTTQLPVVARVDAIIHSHEGFREHESGEPRRLVHEVVASEFNKANVIHIVNPEDKTHKNFPDAPYHVGVTLIAFNPGPNMPVRVSISLQLVEYRTRKVLVSSDKAADISSTDLDACLKKNNRDFDDSTYGKLLKVLSINSVKAFDEKVSELHLENRSNSISKPD